MKPGSSPIRRLFPILLLNLIAFAIAIPVLPSLAYAVGGDALDVGLLYAAQSLGQFLMAPVWGLVSDRIGRKPVLIATFLAAAILELITAFLASLPLLYLTRFTVGLCAGNVATASALIADSTDHENRSKAMAVIGISFAVGFTLGPFIGAMVGLATEPGLTGLSGAGLPFVVAAGINLVAAGLGSFVLLEPPTNTRQRRSNRRRLPGRTILNQLREGPISLISLVFLIYTIAITTLEGIFFVYMEAVYGYDIVEVGFIFAAMGLLMVLYHGAIGPLSRRIGDESMTLLGIALLGLGLLIAPFNQALWFFFLFLGIATFGRAVVHPGTLAMMSNQSQGTSETGQLMGILQSAASLGRILGPAIGGFLFATLSPAAPFFFAGGILLLTALTWLLLRPHTLRPQNSGR